MPDFYVGFYHTMSRSCRKCGRSHDLVPLTDWSWQLRDLDDKPAPARLAVLTMLASHMDPKTGCGKATVRQLMQDTRAGRDTVQCALRWARSVGIVIQPVRGHRLGDGRTVPSQWQLVNLKVRENGPCESQGTPTGTLAFKSSTEAKASVGTTRAREVPMNNQMCLPLEGLPSNPPAPPTPAVIMEAFGRFWEAYPRRVGKKAAKSAFERALRDGASIKQIAQGVRRYAEYAQRCGDLKFIKHPTTWLNQGCWDDELEDELHARRLARAQSTTDDRVAAGMRVAARYAEQEAKEIEQ